MKRIFRETAPNGVIVEVHHSERWNDYTVLVRKSVRDQGEAVFTSNDKDRVLKTAEAKLAEQTT